MKIFLSISLLLSALNLQAEEIRGWWDIAPREYPDLAISYREVAKENNGLADITAISTTLRDCAEHESWMKTLKKKQHPKRSPQLLKLHSDSLSQLDSALAKDIQSDFEIDITASAEAELNTIKVANFLSACAETEAHEGKHSNAMAYLKRMNLLADKMIHTDGSLINYLVGVAIYSKAYDTTINLLSHPTTQAVELIKISTLSAKTPNFKARFKSATNYEFAISQKLILDLHRGSKGYDLVLNPSLFKYSKFLFGSPRSGHPLLQPNKTIQAFAREARALRKDVDQPLLAPKSGAVRKRGLFSLISPNAIGNALFQMSGHSIKASNAQTPIISHQTTQLLIALRHYQLDHAELPEDLNQLIPVYLKQLPLDPFSAKPLHYSKKRKLIWSIGDDFKDNNGVSRDDRKGKNPRPLDGLRNLDEPSARIPF